MNNDKPKHPQKQGKITKNPVFSSIRSGFVSIIPVLMIGSFVLAILNLPIDIWKTFISEFLGGAVRQMLLFAYYGTFGMLSVYVTISVSLQFSKKLLKTGYFTATVASLICFLILSGFNPDDPVPTISALGAKGMFTAIFSALLTTYLYSVAYKFAIKRKTDKIAADGADTFLNEAMSTIFPAIFVIAIFAVLNSCLTFFFGVNGFQHMFIEGVNLVFSKMGRSFISGFLYLLISGLLWFCGIHGSDVLEGVSQTLFDPSLEINGSLVAVGELPTEIVTKPFFDTFVVMGGCGSTLCLLLALIIFSKRRSNRNVARLSALPMIFNINEPMVFGLPLIFNKTMFIPFILTPLLLYSISYGATAMGLVPMVWHPIGWTEPIIWSGITATGSVAGALLQVFNLCIGTLLYAPFIIKYDKVREKEAGQMVEKLVDALKESEALNKYISLVELNDELGVTALSLIADLRYALNKEQLVLKYQPQYNYDGHLVGAEALLRWNHPIYGFIYPPMIIKLAEDAKILIELEKYIVKRVLKDSYEINKKRQDPISFSVNVSAKTFQRPVFAEFLYKQSESPEFVRGVIYVEITEQTVFTTTESNMEIVKNLHKCGYKLAIDDFPMGHTSLQYLQKADFDEVKLDGSLIRDIGKDPRCDDIVSSMIHLSKLLEFTVIAEFVETNEQREALHALGCSLYQGYLYSPAVDIEKIIEMSDVDLSNKK